MTALRHDRGFTLIEVMTVVVIIGVLATLATYGVRKYVLAAKSSEAIHMIGLIKSAQESYRDETFTYANVSGGDATALYPNDDGDSGFGKQKRMWVYGTPTELWNKWKVLGIHSDSPLQFGYSCTAGAAGATPTQPPHWGGEFEYGDHATAKEVWYVASAVGDLNGDGVKSVYFSPSFATQIFDKNDGE